MRRRRTISVVRPLARVGPRASLGTRWTTGTLAALLATSGLLHCGGDGDRTTPRVDLPERADVTDAGRDALATVETDAGTTPTLPCDPDKPFGAPVPVPGLDPMAFAATPRLAHDELTLYFTSMDATLALGRLTRAVRATRTDPFGAPSILAAQTAAAASDHDPAIASDGLSIWFHSSRSGNLDLFTATRATRSDDFGAPAPVAEVNTAGNEAHPYFRKGGDELWFVADRGAGWDIYVASRDGASFGVATRVAELSSTADDWQPMITEDGRTAVFASTRPGGLGLFDLWIARRPNAAAPFGAPVPLTELNSASQEFSGWVSADGCRIWFSSDRAAPGVRQNLYYAERAR